MSSTINLMLTDELRAFVDANCGDGTDFATPSEYMRSMLREKKDRQEAAAYRDHIVLGLSDIIKGRTVAYNGSIRETMAEAKKRRDEGWK